MWVLCFVLQGACSKSVIEDIVVSSYRRIDGLHTLEVLLFSVRHNYVRTCPNPVDMENSDLASVEFWDHFIMHVFIVQIWLASLWICWQITCRGSERSCSEVFLVPWFYLFKEIEFFHFGYARFLHLSIYVLSKCAQSGYCSNLCKIKILHIVCLGICLWQYGGIVFDLVNQLC